jgi:hypothetical protein
MDTKLGKIATEVRKNGEKPMISTLLGGVFAL